MTSIKNQKISIVILVLFFLFSANFAFAICDMKGIVPCGSCLDYDETGQCINPQPKCEFCHLFVLLNNMVTFILTCLVPIFAGLMTVIGGLYLLVAGAGQELADPALFTKAKSILTGGAIGLVVIFVSWVFINTFLQSIGLADWTHLEEGWWEITKWWHMNCPQ